MPADAAERPPTSGAAEVAQSRLLLLLDSRSPAGAHSHSGGMEAAVAAGHVTSVGEVADFCRGRLRTAGRVLSAFAAAACQAWSDHSDADRWAELDAELSARTPSEVTRAASRTLGSGLRRLLIATTPDVAGHITSRFALCPRPAPHHVLVLGAGVALTGGDPSMAARAAALGICTSSASAAVRLLGLDPYQTHFVVAELSDDIEALARDAVRYDATDLPADSAPALDLLADVHAQMETRLFAS